MNKKNIDQSFLVEELHNEVHNNIKALKSNKISKESLVNISPDKIDIENFLQYCLSMPEHVRNTFQNNLIESIQERDTNETYKFGMPIFTGFFTPHVFNNIEAEIFKVYLNCKALSFGPGRINYTLDGVKEAPAILNGLSIEEEKKTINYGYFEIDKENNVSMVAGGTIVFLKEIDLGGGEIAKFDSGIWKVTKVFAMNPGHGYGEKLMKSINEFIPKAFPSQKAICLHSRFCYIPKEIHGVNNDRTAFYLRTKSQGEGKEYTMVGVPYIEYEGNKESGAIPNWWMFNKEAMKNFKKDQEAYNKYTAEMKSLRKKVISLLRLKPYKSEIKGIFNRMVELAKITGISNGKINVDSIIEEYVENGMIKREEN